MRTKKNKHQFRPGDIVTINKFIEYPTMYDGPKNPRTYRIAKLLDVPVPKQARYYDDYSDYDYEEYDSPRLTVRERTGATQHAILAPNRTMDKIYREVYGGEPMRIRGKVLKHLSKRYTTFSCGWLTLVHRPKK